MFLTAGSRWIPHTYETLAEFNLTVHVPSPLVTVTQGREVARQVATAPGFDPTSRQVELDTPVSTRQGPSFETTRFESTVPTDGVALSAGVYRRATRQVEGVQLSTFFYTQHHMHADLWLDSAEATVRRYAPLLGAYPHPKFDIVENFFQSGYGMPGYTLLGDRVIEYVTKKAKRHGGKIPPGYLDHEYVHGWYGNGLFVDYADGNWCEAITTYLANYLAVEIDAGGDPEAEPAVTHRRAVMEKFAIPRKGRR